MTLQTGKLVHSAGARPPPSQPRQSAARDYRVEVQSGSYFGEDNVVRFEDTYGRGSPTESKECSVQIK